MNGLARIIEHELTAEQPTSLSITRSATDRSLLARLWVLDRRTAVRRAIDLIAAGGGLLVLALGFSGLIGRLAHWLPVPIVMAMIAGAVAALKASVIDPVRCLRYE